MKHKIKTYKHVCLLGNSRIFVRIFASPNFSRSNKPVNIGISKRVPTRNHNLFIRRFICIFFFHVTQFSLQRVLVENHFAFACLIVYRPSRVDSQRITRCSNEDHVRIRIYFVCCYFGMNYRPTVPDI